MSNSTDQESAISAPRMTRRGFSGKAVATAIVAGLGATHLVNAAPNGTRPTKLVDLAAQSISSTKMRVVGRVLTIDNRPIAGLAVSIYSVGVAHFSRWSTVYTASDGRFTSTTNKVPVGSQIQVEVEGNGAYSRAYPTLPRV